MKIPGQAKKGRKITGRWRIKMSYCIIDENLMTK